MSAQDKGVGHTPTPYVVNGFGGDFEVIARMQPHEVAISARSSHRDEIATATFIVEACNSHASLQVQNDMLARALFDALSTFCTCIGEAAYAEFQAGNSKIASAEALLTTIYKFSSLSASRGGK